MMRVLRWCHAVDGLRGQIVWHVLESTILVQGALVVRSLTIRTYTGPVVVAVDLALRHCRLLAHADCTIDGIVHICFRCRRGLVLRMMSHSLPKMEEQLSSTAMC
jgi:hypothetical protein